MGNSTNKILLTGAGFTHNFGTPLAREFWHLIFNNQRIQEDNVLRKLLISDFDYESVYASVINGDYSDSQKAAINDAVSDAYEKLDYTIRNWLYKKESLFPVNIYGVQDFINQFSIMNKKGFVFTTNQDLFMERQYYNGERLDIPGMQTKENWFSSIFRRALKESDYSDLPTEEYLEQNKNRIISSHNFFYIKLHGSCNWRSSLRARQMVIGKAKREQIQTEPLLEWYFEIFKDVICQGGQDLLVIGYGFGDEHINEVIYQAVLKDELNIYVISPQPIEEFLATVTRNKYGDEILGNLKGYFPYTLLQMFPPDDSKSQAWIEVREGFFGIK